MMQITVPVESGNATLKDGTLPRTLEDTLKRVRAEAAYFTTDGSGRRCGFVFFDLADASDIPSIAEPLFHNLHAAVEFRPAMNADDLQAGIEAWLSGKA